MGIMDKLIGKPAVSAVEAVGDVVTDVFGSKDRKLSHAEFMAELAQKPQLAQIAVNQVEAGHRSLFVAGWRPFIGWVCGFGLAYAFVLDPFLQNFGVGFTDQGNRFVQLPLDYLLEIVIGLLGLGALRTAEKLRGKAK